MSEKTEFRLTVDIPTALKLRLDIHSKLEGRELKEITAEALEQYLPKYFVKIRE